MKLQLNHIFRAGLLILAFLLITGCAVALVGLVAGVGTATYVNGKLIKTYRSEYHQTVQASINTLENLKIPINENISDELKTSIKATRPDGTPIRVEIVRMEKELTEVGVRTGSIGLWDKKVSGQIQDDIEKKLYKISASEESNLTDNRTQIQSFKSSQTSVDETIPNSTDTQKSTQEHKSVTYDDFTIFFSHNSNEISAGQIEKLDNIVQRILNMPNAKVVLNGYTDSSGNGSYNKMVSESRAAAIKAYLIGKGVEPEDIRIIGHGAKDFISNNNTIESRNRNRRVEIVISP
jgi:outer membrane protein OmpA-like peptidoglycan-associated protein